MDEPERPDDDADASEIAEWMEHSFEISLLDGLRDAVDDNGQEGTSDDGDGA